MHDQFGRLHHDQRHRNSGMTSSGSYVDTIEVGFSGSVTNSKKEKMRKIIEETFLDGKVELVSWPSDVRCNVGLSPGYYKLDDLKRNLLKRHYKIDCLNYYYSARLSG